MNPTTNGTVLVGDERYILLTGAYSGVLVARHDGTYMSRLTIHNATKKHTGHYICSTTKFGSFKYLGAYLKVISSSQLALLFCAYNSILKLSVIFVSFVKC